MSLALKRRLDRAEKAVAVLHGERLLRELLVVVQALDVLPAEERDEQVAALRRNPDAAAVRLRVPAKSARMLAEMLDQLEALSDGELCRVLGYTEPSRALGDDGEAVWR